MRPHLRTICILASLLTGCAGMLGGATHEKVRVDKTPSAALAALRQAHPTAQIDRVEGTWSNGRPLYQIYYYEGSGTKRSDECRYSDHGNLSAFQLYPPKVKAAFQQLHPDAAIDRVESFEDVPAGESVFRIQFHVANGSPGKVCFKADGEPCASPVADD